MKDEHKMDTMPTPLDFMLRTPLYKSFIILPPSVIYDLRYFKGTLDCFCTGCGKHATFKGETPPPPTKNHLAASIKSSGDAFVNSIIDALPFTETFQVQIRCTREHSHVYYFIFCIESKYYNPRDSKEPPVKLGTITKIGQFPSYADINSESISKYRKILDRELFADLSRAIGLASHDIGAGSFVYLRRIFESLIKEAANQAGLSDEKYVKLYMDEKIAELKNYLPSFLYDNRVMYAILSKGIHELTEDECLTHFDVVKTGIELILDEKIEQVEKAKKIERARKAIQQVHGKLTEK